MTDPEWKKAPKKEKDSIFKSMQEHHSFCIPDFEINRVFEEMLLNIDRETLNKDWLENFSENAYPSFSKFVIQKADKVFIQISTK